jgi:hypothetical protein
LPELPPLLVRSLRELPMVRVQRVLAARPLVVDGDVAVAVVVALAAPVDLYVFTTSLRFHYPSSTVLIIF